MVLTTDERIVNATKFPPEFKQKVDMSKVNLAVMKKCVQPHHESLLTKALMYVL